MVDMKLSKEEVKEYSSAPAVLDKPRYPYGLRVCLCQESLEKLGIKELPEVGKKLTMKAEVEVCSVSMNESQDGGAHKSMELQIVGMELYKTTRPAGEGLYGE